MHAAPSSWPVRGRLVEQQRGEEDRAERLEGEHHRAERGGQARERDRDQQPAEDLRAEREHDQPAGRAERRRQVEVAGDRAVDAAADRGRQRGVEERTGRSAQVTARLAQREQEPRVRDAGQHPEDRPERRVRTVRALLEDAGDEDRRRRRRSGSTRARHAADARRARPTRAPRRARPACSRARSRAPRRPARSRCARGSGRPRRTRPRSTRSAVLDAGAARSAGPRARRAARAAAAPRDSGRTRPWSARPPSSDRGSPRTRSRAHPRARAGSVAGRAPSRAPEGSTGSFSLRVRKRKSGPPHRPLSRLVGGARRIGAPFFNLEGVSHDGARLIPPPFADSPVRFTFSPTWGRRRRANLSHSELARVVGGRSPLSRGRRRLGTTRVAVEVFGSVPVCERQGAGLTRSNERACSQKPPNLSARSSFSSARSSERSRSHVSERSLEQLVGSNLLRNRRGNPRRGRRGVRSSPCSRWRWPRRWPVARTGRDTRAESLARLVRRRTRPRPPSSSAPLSARAQRASVQLRVRADELERPRRPPQPRRPQFPRLQPNSRASF